MSWRNVFEVINSEQSNKQENPGHALSLNDVDHTDGDNSQLLPAFVSVTPMQRNCSRQNYNLRFLFSNFPERLANNAVCLSLSISSLLSRA